MDEVMHRLGANYKKTGPGILRKIPQEDLDEVQRIFDETGATERYRKIEEYSRIKADEMGINLEPGLDNDYIRHIYTVNEKDHTKDA
jgi:heterodisulfide reductase subunit C